MCQTLGPYATWPNVGQNYLPSLGKKNQSVWKTENMPNTLVRWHTFSTVSGVFVSLNLILLIRAELQFNSTKNYGTSFRYMKHHRYQKSIFLLKMAKMGKNRRSPPHFYSNYITSSTINGCLYWKMPMLNVHTYSPSLFYLTVSNLKCFYFICFLQTLFCKYWWKYNPIN